MLEKMGVEVEEMVATLDSAQKQLDWPTQIPPLSLHYNSYIR